MTPQLEVSNLVGPVIAAFKKISNEWDEFLEIGLSDYLYSQANKYYFTNTFIHRNEKVKFNEIYYPVQASYKHLNTDFNALEDVLDEYKAITIIGSAGSGKTTLIKYIFLRAVELRARIPILIELRNLNDYNGNFEKLISDKVLGARVKPSDDIFRRTLKSGKFLFLLDGYDEIFSIKKQETNRQIELFVDSYSENRFLLTTRPGSGIESFPRFFNFSVLPLSDDDVLGFISKIVEDAERKVRIIQIVQDPSNKNYFEFLRNPLLLSMFILAFENHPEIPGRKSAFYKNVFDTLYSRHDGITKNSFPREKLTKLQRDDFESVLSTFSYLSLIRGKYSFTHEFLSDLLGNVGEYLNYSYSVEDMIYDLHTSISILILDGFEYAFPHRSMQEFFAAVFVSKLSSEKKEKAYQNLSDALQRSSTDYSFTFWKLCFELDESAFVTNFLVPNLKELYDLLNHADVDKMYSGYIQIAYPSIDKSVGKEGFKIIHSANFKDALLDFSEAYRYNDLYDFFQLNSLQDTIEGLYKNRAEETPLNVLDSDVFSVLHGNGFTTLLLSIKDSLMSKIQMWEESVSKKESSIDDLLSL